MRKLFVVMLVVFVCLMLRGDVSHNGAEKPQRVVLTGSFYTMSRKQIGELIESRGAKLDKSVNRKIDLLVVGGMASRDWAFSSFGRKIEEALTVRKYGTPLLIIDEKQITEWLNESITAYDAGE